MASPLPDYVASARPVPQQNRVAWFKSTAQTYAGIMLWFVFWQKIVCGDNTPGGVLSAGIMPAIIGLVVAAAICHFLFYLVPGLLGMKTGLPLYVVGTSTYGVRGGLFMPGFLMGLLQFGWLAVNASAVAVLLCTCFGLPDKPQTLGHGVIATVFAVVCAFIGLKGIQYVAKVATYLPLIPLVVLAILLATTIGGVGGFTPEKITMVGGDAAATDAVVTAVNQAATTVAKETPGPLTTWGVIVFLCTYIVGFFATAGAAGADIASNNRDENDVQLGGLTGITLATIISGGATILIVAGAYGAGLVPKGMLGELNPLELMKGTETEAGLLSATTARIIMIALAVSSLPAACFSAFIAANSFKTTMPKVNPFISVGIGTLVAVILAVTGAADQIFVVFKIIGASFGPVCGAMAADYLLSGRQWAGPRAGFNPAGWISWAIGFFVGASDVIAAYVPALGSLKGVIPCPPVAAFAVGFVLYIILAQLGLQSRTLEMPREK